MKLTLRILLHGRRKRTGRAVLPSTGIWLKHTCGW